MKVFGVAHLDVYEGLPGLEVLLLDDGVVLANLDGAVVLRKE